MKNPCRDESQLSAYMDGELTGAESNDIQRHLEICPQCQRQLDQLEAVDALMHRMPEIEPGADFDRTFWQKVDAAQQRSEARWWHRWIQPGWRPAFAVTGLAGALIIGVFILVGLNTDVSMDDRFMAENSEMLMEYDLIESLEILENWDAINSFKELS